MFFRCSTKFNSCLIIRPPVRAFASLRISPRVQHALSQGLPVVCLESTIITHGMSYPANLAMAKAVERIVEENGATPATIAILDGQARVGLELSDLEALAMVGRKARKVSRRDLASAIADKATGGTTVSGTMILAKKAGVSSCLVARRYDTNTDLDQGVRHWRHWRGASQCRSHNGHIQ